MYLAFLFGVFIVYEIVARIAEYNRRQDRDEERRNRIRLLGQQGQEPGEF